MGKSLKEMGWRQPVGVKKLIQAIFNKSAGILEVNGKQYDARNWSDADFEDFCGEFGAPAIYPKGSRAFTAILEKDPAAELDKALKVIESKRRPTTKRVVRENDELIDAAASPEAVTASAWPSSEGLEDPDAMVNTAIVARFKNGVLQVSGKRWKVPHWTPEDFEEFATEFGAMGAMPSTAGNSYSAVLERDPVPELDELLGTGNSSVQETKNDMKKKTIRENDSELIDAAAGAGAGNPVPPAPQPVPMPQNAAPAADPAAQPGPMNPLVPPAPGMIPTGWMFPNQSAQAVAMDTGDVNLAAAAPGGGVVEGQPVTNEEAQLVTEYRKFAKKKRLEKLAAKLAKRVKENSEEELEPEMPENPELAMPPAEEPEFEEEGSFEDDDAAEGTAGITAEDLEDIVVDINKLFADAGGDLAAVTSEDAFEDEEAEEAEEATEDAVEGAEEDFEDEAGSESESEPVNESRKGRRKENKIADILGEDEYDTAVDDIDWDEGGSWDPEEAAMDDAIPADDEFTEDEIPVELDPGNTIQDYGQPASLYDTLAQRNSPTWRSGQKPLGTDLGEARKPGKRSWREAALPANAVDIKFPAGTQPPNVSSAAVDAAYDVPAGSAIQAMEKRTAARRAVLEELRRRNRKAEGLADGDLGDAMKTQEEVIDEVIPGSNKSAILTEARKSPSSKFLESYKEKQQLDYRKMLEQGLLG